MWGMAAMLAGAMCLAACSEEENLTGGNGTGENGQGGQEMEGIVIDTPAGGWKTPRCKVLKVVPTVTDGKEYDFRWMMGDSLVAAKKELEFIALATGKHTLTLWATERNNPEQKGKSEIEIEIEIEIEVVNEQKPYSPYVTSVPDFRPAPGQFVNELPLYEEGDTQEDMNRKALKSIGNNARSLVSLGGFGGYIVCGFDHTIVNVPGEYDFKVLGNAFLSNGNPNPDAPATGGSMEPGIVMVAYDRNGNGKPDDDEWYELAGSEYHKDTTEKHYTITYFRPDPDREPAEAPQNEQHWNLDAEYIEWNDSKNATGYIPKNKFHSQNYYPNWIEEDELTFEGTCLPPNAVDESLEKDGSYWVLYGYDWGYADNYPNEDERAGMKIEWAVDKDGNQVHLPGIDFVKVYTGVNQCAGWLGETSTEVMGVNDLHLLKP